MKGQSLRHRLERLEERLRINASMDTDAEPLTDREKIVLQLRHGLGVDAMTLEGIAARLSTTRERVRQIEAKAIRKMSRKEAK